MTKTQVIIYLKQHLQRINYSRSPNIAEQLIAQRKEIATQGEDIFSSTLNRNETKNKNRQQKVNADHDDKKVRIAEDGSESGANEGRN